MRTIALALLFFCALTPVAVAQGSYGGTHVGDVAVTYQWVHTNTQPGDCGCFGLNGGGISGSWELSPRWAAAAEFSVDHAGNGPSTGNSLTLVSYMGGVRYSVSRPEMRTLYRPVTFAQALVGAGHAGGGIAGAGDGNYALVGRVGGGIDVPMRAGLSLRALQIDYFLSRFDNAVNSRQNNLLIGAGIVVRWSR